MTVRPPWRKEKPAPPPLPEADEQSAAIDRAKRRAHDVFERTDSILDDYRRQDETLRKSNGAS